VDSGTDSQDQPLSGVLEFLDPRAGAEAVSAPGDPYGELFRVRAQAGLLVMFPSWLYHWVHPYAGETPRIAISFNATVGAHAVDKADVDEGRALQSQPILLTNSRLTSSTGHQQWRT
jgi:hypothetical protein